MSRGPGRIQQAITRAFEANPSAVYCAKEIIELAFPQIKHEAKHRVAALRAARTLANGSNRFETYIGAPSAGGLLLVNVANTRSLAIGRVFKHFAGTRPISECVAFLDNPTTEAFIEAQPGGFFDLLARRNALCAEWRDDEAEVLSVLIRERIAEAQRTRTTITNQRDQGAHAMSDDSQENITTAAQLIPREPISALGSAHAPTIYFDESAFFGAINDVGEIALAVTRYCDVHGSQVQSERVLVGHLRGSLPALKTLNYAVEVVIKMLETEREREAASNQAMAMLRDAAEPEFRN